MGNRNINDHLKIKTQKCHAVIINHNNDELFDIRGWTWGIKTAEADYRVSTCFTGNDLWGNISSQYLRKSWEDQENIEG